MKKVLLIGATSAIAEATARRFAAAGDRLFLLGRNAERLSTIAVDLQVRGAEKVHHQAFDANDFAGHPDLLQKALDTLGGIDVVLIAHGTLPDQKACEKDFARTLAEFNTNALSVISMLTWLGNHFEAQGSGTIAVISSVAGDRGRQSNYVYGSAKGAVSLFLQGLRNRLHPAGVQVLTIKPGFVDTPMTAEFKKGPLWAVPDTVAEGIVRAIDKHRNVVYLPFFWLFIMMIIRSVPEVIFKRAKL